MSDPRPPSQGPDASLLGGRYRLLERLGGATWRARDEMLHRGVAITEVPLPAGPDRDHLLRGVRAAAALRHPSIVTTHDVIPAGDRLWVVRELVEGRSLTQLLRSEGPQPAQRVAEIGLRVLEAVTAARAHGVRHARLDTDAVTLAADGRVVVTGFGITYPGQEPEELRDLGALLHMTLEGSAPGRTATPMSLSGKPLVASDTARMPAGPLAPLLFELLDDDPAHRPDADSVRLSLIGMSRPRRSRTRPVAITAGVLAVAAVAVAGVVFLRPAERPVARPAATPTTTAPTPTVAPLPRSFAARPDPCGLVSAEQLAALALSPSMTRGENDCKWSTADGNVPDNLKYTLWIHVLHYVPKYGDTATERARINLVRLREQEGGRTTADNGTALVHHVRPRPLPDLGDAAFTYETTNGISYNSAVLFRVANLIVAVQYQRDIPTDPDHSGREGAYKAARFALDGLREK